MQKIYNQIEGYLVFLLKIINTIFFDGIPSCYGKLNWQQENTQMEVNKSEIVYKDFKLVSFAIMLMRSVN